MSGKRSKSEFIDNPIKNEELKMEDDDDDDKFDDEKKSNKTSWGIFRDDFLTDKKMSNWDKNNDVREEVEDRNVQESGSDDDSS